MNINFKDKKTWLIIGAIVLVVVVVVIIIRKKNKIEVKETESGGLTANGTNAVLTTETSFPLKPKSLVGEYSASKGSYGNRIVILQMIYNKLCSEETGTTLDVDGKYGPKTMAALQSRFSGCVADDGTITKENYDNIIFMATEYGVKGIQLNNTKD